MVDKMESTERRSAYVTEASSETLKDDPGDRRHSTRAVAVLGVPPHVEAGTHSTDEPNPTAETSPLYKDRDRDGSVISAMTDMVSLEGPNVDVPSILGEEETASQQSLEPYEDHNIPKQVILPDDSQPFPSHDDGSSPPPPSHGSSPTNEEKMVVLLSTPHQRKSETEVATVTSTVTASIAGQQRVDADDSVCRSTITEADTINATFTQNSSRNLLASKETAKDEMAYDGGMDDYIRSPEVQNAIVERSPGGRYVRFMEKLGSGASKDVYRAYDTQEGIEVAWNVVNLSGVPKSERNRIVNEVRLLERLHHQNIISFHGSWVNRERQEVNFVTEILSSGTLKSFINKVQVIRWKIAKRWALQILKGLEYLHSQDPPVIHRDLKCENIFINGTSGDLRIGDLGLSTVHRNGKVLSVLGTPEFMAPDMYEENSYNEKVDVYAFGMCLLEIFTKEIPYSECSNPAQIYKKVSAGEPPEVLSRLQSKHAREFVMLCLGYRDENGNFIRPSVSELLVHPFLDKRANDDDEVVVDRPLRERTITETSGDSISSTPVVKRKTAANSSFTQSQQQTQGQLTHSEGTGTPPSARKLAPVAASALQDEDDGDRFEEMQESEINMRKVKVLMGRGQELQDDDEIRNEGVTEERVSLPVDNRLEASEEQGMVHSHAGQAQVPPPPPSAVGQQQSPGRPPQEDQVAAFHYLVAAAVIENENPNVRPYADDILKLVVTLPLDGQTHVQFDFHLVEDDPVQVAKEMVKELGIPQGAVLEISETISGLARTARMKQDKHTVCLQSVQSQQSSFHQGIPPVKQHSMQQFHLRNPMQNAQPDATLYQVEHGPPYQQHVGQVSQHPHLNGMPGTQSQQDLSQYQKDYQKSALQQGKPVAQSEEPVFSQKSPSNSHQMRGSLTSGAVVEASKYPQAPAGPSLQSQQMQYPEPLLNDTHQEHSLYQPGPATTAQSQQSGLMVGTVTGDIPHFAQQQTSHYLAQQIVQPSNMARDVPHGNPNDTQEPLQFNQPMPPSAMPHDVHPQQRHHIGSLPEYAGSRPQTQPYQAPDPQFMYGSSYGVYGNDGSTLPLPAQAPVQTSPPLQPVFPSAVGHVAPHPVPVQLTSATPVGHAMHVPQSMQPAPVSHSDPTLPPSSNQNAHMQAAVIATLVDPISPRDQAAIPENSSSQSTIVSNRPNAVGSAPVAPSEPGNTNSNGDTDVDSDNDEVSDELRKLDEDFQKNLERARKVFVNRMDNLQRSQIEREAQHQKTLEKHEKERAEFEKRLAQEAEQQNRRIEQLQREWDKRRESVAMNKRRPKEASAAISSDVAPDVGASSGSSSASHLRSGSSASSTFSVSPAMSLHKLPQQEPNVDGAQSEK
jgi:WNK lysine deficient protein kinase